MAIETSIHKKPFAFEIILSLFLLVNVLRDLYVLQKLGKDQIDSEIFSWGNAQTIFLGGFLFFLKLKQEGSRINSIFAVSSFSLIIILRCLQYQSKTLLAIQVILLVAYFSAVVFMPVWKFPGVQGSFKSGLKQMRIQDSFKTEISVFYPVLAKDIHPRRALAKWAQQTFKKYSTTMHESMEISPVQIPLWFFEIATSFVNQMLFSCAPNAPLAKSNDKDNTETINSSSQRFPVVIFSHGLAAHRQAYSVFLTDLASKGYIVFSVSHEEEIYPDELLAAIKENKEETFHGIRAKQLAQRCNQIENVAQVIKNKDLMTKLFEREVYLDTENIILMGHSFGGATAIQTALTNNKLFKGVVALDPWVTPIDDSVLALPYSYPLLVINTQTFAQENPSYKLREKCRVIFEAGKSSKTHASKVFGEMLGTDHLSQGDICFLMPKETVITKMVRSNSTLLLTTQATRFLISEFLENVVLAKPKNTAKAVEEVLSQLEIFTQKHFKRGGQFQIMFD